MHKGIIYGCSSAFVLLLITVVIICVCYRKRKTQRKTIKQAPSVRMLDLHNSVEPELPERCKLVCPRPETGNHYEPRDVGPIGSTVDEENPPEAPYITILASQPSRRDFCGPSEYHLAQTDIAATVEPICSNMQDRNPPPSPYITKLAGRPGRRDLCGPPENHIAKPVLPATCATSRRDKSLQKAASKCLPVLLNETKRSDNTPVSRENDVEDEDYEIPEVPTANICDEYYVGHDPDYTDHDPGEEYENQEVSDTNILGEEDDEDEDYEIPEGEDYMKILSP